MLVFLARMLPVVLLLCWLPVPAGASEEITLSRLYSRPYLWGAAPSRTRWAEDNSRQFAFLWNREGQLFRELYVGNSRGGEWFQLTEMSRVEPLPYEEDKRSDEDKERDRELSRGITSYVWRPDGREIAFEYQGDIWRIEPRRGAEPRRLMQTRAAESQLQYSPDGRRLSFVRDGNLWCYHLDDGRLLQVTTVPSGKSIHAYQWFRDGKRLLVRESDTSKLKEILIPDYIPRGVEVKRRRRANAGEPGGHYRFGIVPAEGGLVRWHERDLKTLLFDVEPAPDGARLAYQEVSPDFKSRALFVIDASSLAAEQVYSETTETWFEERDIEWSADGGSLYFLSGRGGWRHLYRLPLDATEAGPVNMTPGEFDVVAYEVLPGSGLIHYEAFRPTPLERNVYRLDPHSGATARLGGLEGSSRASHSPDGRYSMLSNSSHTRPPDSYLVDHRRPGTARRVTHSPLPDFARVPLATPETVQFSGPDGRTLWGSLFLPPDRAPGRHHPAILAWVYANSAKNHWGSILNHWMATRGYAVLLVDFRASDGYGEDFGKGYYRSMGIVDASECVAAARFLAGLPHIDGTRLGMFGWSYGGFLTHMVLFQHPGVFKAGLSVAPVNDWENYNYFYTGQRLDTPRDASEVYRLTSPIHLAEGLSDSLLMVHGMQDDNVLFQDTVQLVQKLIEKNKDFQVMFYPRDDHGINRDESRVHLMNLMMRYFDQQLRPWIAD